MKEYRSIYSHGRLLGIVILGGLLSFGGLIGCGRETTESLVEESATRNVEVAPVTPRNFERSIVATGSLRAQQQAMIRAITDGPIEVVPVEIGETVAEGQVLFQVRLSDAELAVQSAEAGLRITEANLADLRAWQRPEEVASRRAGMNQAEAEYRRLDRERERMETLFERGSVSQSEWDMARTAAESAQAAYESAQQQLNIASTGPTREQIAVVEAQVAQAEAALSQARQILQDATIRAPFDGVVIQRMKKAGDFVNRGEPVVELANVELLEAEMRVPERYARLIQPGAQLEVMLESINLKRDGAVFAVNQHVDAATRTFEVKVEVPNRDKEIKAGMFCTGVFHLPTKSDVPAVPNEALVQEEGRYYVWLADDDIATRVEVTLGERDSDYREILSGIEPGDQVIVEGKGALTEGIALNIQENITENQ